MPKPNPVIYELPPKEREEALKRYHRKMWWRYNGNFVFFCVSLVFILAGFAVAFVLDNTGR